MKLRIIQRSIIVGAALLLHSSIQADTTNASAVFATDPGAGANANPAITNAAAIVDGHIIPLEDVKFKCLREYRFVMVNVLIQHYVLDRECKKRGITVSETEIDQRIAALRTNLAPIILEDKLKQNHITMAEVRDDMRFEIEKPLLVAGQSNLLHMVHCRELIVPIDSSHSESNAFAMAMDLRRQILAGADFATMAAQHSDPGAAVKSGEKNGDMGVLYEKIFRPVEAPVLDAALALKAGEISQPVKASDGYHLVKAESDDAHHPQSENALYAAAKRSHQEMFEIPQTISKLTDQSKITFADDNDLVPGKPMPDAVAVIDGHPIPMENVLDKCLAEGGPHVTDVLVQNYLVDRECEKRGITVKESEIDAKVEALRKQCAPMTIEEGLKIHHTTMAGLRYDFRQGIERIKLAMGQVQPIRMVHARMILVKANSVSESDVQRADQVAKAQIIAIQNELKAGKRFEDLAAQYCLPEDPNKNGDMGIIYPYKPDVDTDLGNAAATMKKGEVSSQPVKTYSGYALLQIISDSDNHPGDEDAAYTKAQNAYSLMESQSLSRDIIIDLIKKSNVVYYIHG